MFERQLKMLSGNTITEITARIGIHIKSNEHGCWECYSECEQLGCIPIYSKGADALQAFLESLARIDSILTTLTNAGNTISWMNDGDCGGFYIVGRKSGSSGQIKGVSDGLELGQPLIQKANQRGQANQRSKSKGANQRSKSKSKSKGSRANQTSKSKGSGLFEMNVNLAG